MRALDRQTCRKRRFPGNVLSDLFSCKGAGRLQVAPFPFAHELTPGETYAPLQFRISPEINQQFLFALEDYRQECVGSQGRPAIVHPVLLLHMSARTRSPSFRLAAGIGSVFARDVVEFSRPALVDEPLTVRWTIREVYERRGRLYQALDTVVINDDGQQVLRREAHSVFFTDSGVHLAMPTLGAAS